jgi:predicted nuclease of predicted toxin-antitoxin system
VNEPIRFHLDEHISPRVAVALRQRGIDVTTTREAGLAELDDPFHLRFATSEKRVIVTKDADFLRMATTIANHPGIVSCRRTTLSLRGLIEGLILIHGVLTPEEMSGHIEYL